MPSDLQQLQRAVESLARTIENRFKQPEFLAGCEIQDITDIDQYATANGWIEVDCAHHGRQRVRYKGFPASIQVGDELDIFHFPDRKAFEIKGAGGTTSTGVDAVKVSKVWKPDGSATTLVADNSSNNTVSGTLDMDGNLIVNLADTLGARDDAVNYYILQGRAFADPVIDRNVVTPPATPNQGDRYLLSSAVAGEWVGHFNTIAEWDGTQWLYWGPFEGQATYVLDENKILYFDGVFWDPIGEAISHTDLQDLASDTHSMYARLDGRSASQKLFGSTANSGFLHLAATASATPTTAHHIAFFIGASGATKVAQITDTGDFSILSGRDLVVYSDALITEQGRWDGATGNFYTLGTMGVGTATVPHAGVGAGMLQIRGAAGALTGPHFQVTGDAHDYPLFQGLFWNEDNITWSFAAYYDGAFKSSDAGSNFAVRKLNDTFGMYYSSGVAQGSAVTFIAGLRLNTSGNVQIANDIFRFVDNDRLGISGGSSIANGANIELYGGTHASLANRAYYDADLHTFRSQAAGTKLTIDNTTNTARFFQRVGIGAEPATSALLELASTTATLLIPRMTTTQKNAMTAVDGMIVYDTSLAKLQVRAAGAWVSVH